MKPLDNYILDWDHHINATGSNQLMGSKSPIHYIQFSIVKQLYRDNNKRLHIIDSMDIANIYTLFA